MRLVMLADAKRLIRGYIRQIPEDALWRLTAMAADGTIEYMDICRCIRGIVGGGTALGYWAEDGRLALMAERGLADLGLNYAGDGWGDYHRNVRLLPMCRAEIRRRDKLRNQEVVQVEAVHAQG